MRLARLVPTPSFAACRGYLLTQVAGGVWADKFGGKPILGFGVVWWSIATALTPIAAQLGLPVRRSPAIKLHLLSVGNGVQACVLLSVCGSDSGEPL